MAKSSSGKWVARAGATGGGRTYRNPIPVNWYGGVVIVVILGLLALGYSRYEYQHPSTASTTPPTVGQNPPWHAALAFDLCGNAETSPPASTNTATAGLVTVGGGVLVIAPKTSAEAGANATLGKFVAEYSGMELTPTSVEYPGGSVMTNGEACATGTPDAGKKGTVQIKTWSGPNATTGTLFKGNPDDVPFTDGEMIVVAFVPLGAAIPKPPATVVASLEEAISTEESASTTTTPNATSTTAPSSTTTTTGSSTTTTTTSSSSTTTTPKSTTTTTKKSSTTTSPPKVTPPSSTTTSTLPATPTTTTTTVPPTTTTTVPPTTTTTAPPSTPST